MTSGAQSHAPTALPLTKGPILLVNGKKNWAQKRSRSYAVKRPANENPIFL